ncbi:methylthioribulose-1-phosphate dehydratase isoform X1 [Anolis carolinensis]|uniref:Methylthioribulose-1-phosphate dehydratase n=1 Tax=Anolis carolinensis TaxID=28377 RepID=A0A803TAA0_ANOCA|nr:PREDICTED: methylthioribulose-1-phosphate dehydratase isoform X1 [Anolis carolinensis]|eukprot:XP_003225217.2 PREDICTED: methylthioribulose-1-phosphate dehydratase isoform X1 [Anolis carolinensis]
MEQSKTLGKIWVVTFAPNQDQRVPCVTSSAFPSFCSITRRLRSASGAGRARGLSSPSHFQQPNRRKEGKQLKSSSMAEPRGDCSCPCRNGWDNTQDKVHPRNLIPELCQQFYHLGWVTGTGGGISIKHGDEIYIAPSGVQKERIQPEDMFVCDIEEQDISGPPSHKKLKKSQCTPLFMNAYTMRGAGAVIHTHSKAAVMATLLYPGSEFKITHQEMIKGIQKCTTGGYFRYDDTLVVPIIENTPEEKDLKERMAKAMIEYPDSCAVLVRRHGVYVWGGTWEKAKTMCECFDYLFDVAVQMKQHGLDPAVVPTKENGIV